MSEWYILQKSGFYPITVRRAPRGDGWEVRRKHETQGDTYHSWEKLPPEIDVEGAIALYRVEKPEPVQSFDVRRVITFIRGEEQEDQEAAYQQMSLF